jgi:hypothetical protein
VSVRRHGDHWLARISVTVGTEKVRKSRLCATRQLALQAERDLAAICRAEAEQTARPEAAPATIRHLCDWYVLDLEQRGRDVTRATTTALAIERYAPDLLAKPIAQVTDRDLFDFRVARLRAGAKPATVSRDLTNISAMLKRARPDYRFPRDVFDDDEGPESVLVTYFVLDRVTQRVKIGRTTRIQERFVTLRRATGLPLELLGTLPGDCEREHHQRFKGARSGPSEWFTLTAALVEFLRITFGAVIQKGD